MQRDKEPDFVDDEDDDDDEDSEEKTSEMTFKSLSKNESIRLSQIY